MSDGSEFQVCGAATMKARRVNSVRVIAAAKGMQAVNLFSNKILPFLTGEAG